MQYAQDYFATRHLLAACLCAVLLVIIDARWFRYHSGVWYLSSRCTHMCAVVCGRPRASTTSASRAELFSNLFSRTRECRTNVSQDKFVWPNNFVSQKSVWAPTRVMACVDVVFSSPRPCFSGFESSSVSRKLEMISSEIVTLLRNSGRKIKRSTFHAKVNLSCKLYYKFYRVVACLVSRWSYFNYYTIQCCCLLRATTPIRVVLIADRYMLYRFIRIFARKIAVGSRKTFLDGQFRYGSYVNLFVQAPISN